MLCSIFDASVIKTHISSDLFVDCIIMIDLYLNLEAEFKHFHRSVLHQCSLICTQMTDSFKLRCFWHDSLLVCSVSLQDLHHSSRLRWYLSSFPSHQRLLNRSVQAAVAVFDQ